MLEPEVGIERPAVVVPSTAAVGDRRRERHAGEARRPHAAGDRSLLEWLGGAIEGRTSGGTLLKVPYNLGIGAGDD